MTDPRRNLPDPEDDPPERADSEYGERIAALASEARRERSAFDPPADPPDEDRALAYARDGVGPVVATYVEAHGGADWTAFSATELDRLDRALNDYLELYARCYGVEMDADFAVREAAQLLIDTHDVVDVAQLLTRVPER